ncbi:hypothetical protein RGU70_05190 [Herbaspirillum sp. RTI4]|uniref:hypothetical protein n=1 Tax=Herbaspirillum sp. RTI4 TaxID=3048640 RepID=UPI002AB4C0FB|nr:hypothetical protein [Herbaspirillum sp. RTI4]MDY7577711.1 hypothetical protein [Herbaspirillum sp. RTI4]
MSRYNPVQPRPATQNDDMAAVEVAEAAEAAELAFDVVIMPSPAITGEPVNEAVDHSAGFP